MPSKVQGGWWPLCFKTLSLPGLFPGGIMTGKDGGGAGRRGSGLCRLPSCPSVGWAAGGGALQGLCAVISLPS